MALHGGGALAVMAAERQVVHHTGSRHSWLLSDLFDQRFVKCEARLPSRVVVPGKRDLAAENMIGPKAGRYGHRTLEAEPQQSSPSQQYKGQGDLGNYKTVPQTLRCTAGGS